MLGTFEQALQSDLTALEAAHRLRSCPAHAGNSRVHTQVAGQALVSFSSNDYLGLACHPSLLTAASESARRSGFGAGAARLVSGDFPEHRELEAALASFLDRPATLLFPTGYQANIGVITALAGPNDLILSDAANHASIVDGCRLSRATVVVYPHLDLAALSGALGAPAAPSFRRRFIVTESAFSMDGDVAPLADLAALAGRHSAALIVDEAHALGALGPGGRGFCPHFGVRPDVLIGTLGKAFGSSGGFVSGSHTLRTTLVNRARTFLFTTAPPPPVAAAALAALAIIRSTEGDRLRSRLHDHIRELGAITTPHRSPSVISTAIFPILLGTDQAALAASARLRAEGIFLQAIRPPTVPEGTARLRATVSAAHEPQDIRLLTRAFGALALPHPAPPSV